MEQRSGGSGSHLGPAGNTMKQRNRNYTFALLVAGLVASAVSSVGATPTTLERIRMSGSVKVCADPASLPLSDAGLQPPGYDLEIAQEIARPLGARLEYHWFAANYGARAVRQMLEGKCDYFMGLPADKSFEESMPRLALSRPYYTTAFVPIVRADLGLRTFKELSGRELGVQMMTVADFILFRQGYARRLYRDPHEILGAMARGELDVAVMWGPFAGWHVKNNPSARLSVIEESRPELTFSLAVGVRKDDQDLKQAIDRVIEDLSRSGRIQEILDRYGVPKFALAAKTANSQAPILLALNEVGLDAQAATTSDISPEPILVAMGGASPPAGTGKSDAAGDKSDAAAVKGRSLYEQACYKCHGPGAVSGGTIPDLRRYKGTESDFLDVVRNGRSGTIMPAMKSFLTDQEILMIRTFVKSVPVT
jgi:ABC-type amino acid transport substrate-binding protein/cytochrome c5